MIGTSIEVRADLQSDFMQMSTLDRLARKTESDSTAVF